MEAKRAYPPLTPENHEQNPEDYSRRRPRLAVFVAQPAARILGEEPKPQAAQDLFVR